LNIPQLEQSFLSNQLSESGSSSSFDSNKANLGKTIPEKRPQSFKISINMDENENKEEQKFKVPNPAEPKKSLKVHAILEPKRPQIISMNLKKEESQ
jgi:hypothetical protein